MDVLEEVSEMYIEDKICVCVVFLPPRKSCSIVASNYQIYFAKLTCLHGEIQGANVTLASCQVMAKTISERLKHFNLPFKKAHLYKIVVLDVYDNQ